MKGNSHERCSHAHDLRVLNSYVTYIIRSRHLSDPAGPGDSIRSAIPVMRGATHSSRTSSPPLQARGGSAERREGRGSGLAGGMEAGEICLKLTGHITQLVDTVLRLRDIDMVAISHLYDLLDALGNCRGGDALLARRVGDAVHILR